MVMAKPNPVKQKKKFVRVVGGVHRDLVEYSGEVSVTIIPPHYHQPWIFEGEDGVRERERRRMRFVPTIDDCR